MSKAVLVMDMPESCAECPLLHHTVDSLYGEEEAVCCVEDEDVLQYADMGEKPDWCPLKYLLDKEKGDEFPDEYSDGYMRGWNACIDAIGGEQT